MAISQRFEHRQFLLVEPLLRVHWLLLSLNGLDSLKAEALVLDGGFLLGAAESAVGTQRTFSEAGGYVRS